MRICRQIRESGDCMSSPFINFFHRPGQGFSNVYAFSVQNTLKSGRPCQSGYERIGSFKGIITETSPQEKEKWKSSEHPVTHKIIQRGTTDLKIKPNDILTIGFDDLSEADKKYFVRAKPRNPGNLNHFTVYYCEERTGIE